MHGFVIYAKCKINIKYLKQNSGTPAEPLKLMELQLKGSILVSYVKNHTKHLSYVELSVKNKIKVYCL